MGASRLLECDAKAHVSRSSLVRATDPSRWLGLASRCPCARRLNRGTCVNGKGCPVPALRSDSKTRLLSVPASWRRSGPGTAREFDSIFVSRPRPFHGCCFDARTLSARGGRPVCFSRPTAGTDGCTARGPCPRSPTLTSGAGECTIGRIGFASRPMDPRRSTVSFLLRVASTPESPSAVSFRRVPRRGHGSGQPMRPSGPSRHEMPARCTYERRATGAPPRGDLLRRSRSSGERAWPSRTLGFPSSISGPGPALGR